MRIKRNRKSSSKLTPDQVQHLVQGWAIDSCRPYFPQTPGFPFASPEARETAWREHRAELVKQWGKVPNVWAHRSRHGDEGELPRKAAEVIPIPVEVIR